MKYVIFINFLLLFALNNVIGSEKNKIEFSISEGPIQSIINGLIGLGGMTSNVHGYEYGVISYDYSASVSYAGVDIVDNKVQIDLNIQIYGGWSVFPVFAWSTNDTYTFRLLADIVTENSISFSNGKFVKICPSLDEPLPQNCGSFFWNGLSYVTCDAIDDVAYNVLASVVNNVECIDISALTSVDFSRFSNEVVSGPDVSFENNKFVMSYTFNKVLNKLSHLVPTIYTPLLLH